MFVTVTDAQRRLMPNLVQEDFEVRDNDKPQPIVLFENKNLPITVVVMLDTSGSMTGSLSLLRDAAEQFLIRLFPDDKAKVGACNDKIEVSGRFSSDRDDLVAEMRGLDYGNGTRLFERWRQSRRAQRHRGSPCDSRVYRRGGHRKPRRRWIDH